LRLVDPKTWMTGAGPGMTQFDLIVE